MPPVTDSPKASDISFNEALLRLCLVHGNEVEFRYAKGDGASIEIRRLVPSSIVRNKDGGLVFQGLDPDRDAPRNYRLERIKGDVRVV